MIQDLSRTLPRELPSDSRSARPPESALRDPSVAPNQRLIYAPPQLQRHGDLRSTVMGPSPGPSESTNANTHE